MEHYNLKHVLEGDTWAIIQDNKWRRVSPTQQKIYEGFFVFSEDVDDVDIFYLKYP